MWIILPCIKDYLFTALGIRYLVMSMLETKKQYLTHVLPNYIEPTKFQKHWFFYQTKRLKRFILHFVIFFICQFIAIGCVSFQGVVPPMYPPMGVAFVILYFFGSSSVFALFFCRSLCLLVATFEYRIHFFLSDSGSCSGLDRHLFMEKHVQYG